MKTTKLNIVAVFFGILLSLSSVASGQAEGEVSARETRDVPVILGTGIPISNQKVEKVVYRKQGELSEALLLTFELADTYIPMTENMLVELTAFRDDGRVLGKSIWPFEGEDPAMTFDGNAAKFTFPIDLNFEVAKKFTIAIRSVDKFGTTSVDELQSGVTCAQCVAHAVDVCGKGNVQSVNCGQTREGSCSFTCKP